MTKESKEGNSLDIQKADLNVNHANFKRSTRRQSHKKQPAMHAEIVQLNTIFDTKSFNQIKPALIEDGPEKIQRLIFVRDQKNKISLCHGVEKLTEDQIKHLDENKIAYKIEDILSEYNLPEDFVDIQNKLLQSEIDKESTVLMKPLSEA